MIIAWINKGEDFDPERTPCLKSGGVFLKKGDASITIEFHQEGGMLNEEKKKS